MSYVTFSAIETWLDPALNAVMSVEINDTLFEDEKRVIEDEIKKREEVESITFVSEDEKLNDIPLEIDWDILGNENPLNGSYEVTLKKEYATTYHINTFAKEVAEIEGVEFVDKPDLKTFEETEKNVSAITLALVIFTALLLFISLILLNNTLRLAIYSKRYLINTMKLVGATKWYIMRPLLGSAFWQGIISGIIAAVLMGSTVYGIVSILPEEANSINLDNLAIFAGGVLVVGVIITVGFSALAINKFVNMKSNKIHLY
jgi:cell division transport system permease protein